jgi:ribosome-interacting GTPase 1
MLTEQEVRFLSEPITVSRAFIKDFEDQITQLKARVAELEQELAAKEHQGGIEIPR